MDEFGEILNNDDSLAEDVLRRLRGCERALEEGREERENGRCNDGNEGCLAKVLLDRAIHCVDPRKGYKPEIMNSTLECLFRWFLHCLDKCRNMLAHIVIAK